MDFIPVRHPCGHRVLLNVRSVQPLLMREFCPAEKQKPFVRQTSPTRQQDDTAPAVVLHGMSPSAIAPLG
jgi:hypothetical protein